MPTTMASKLNMIVTSIFKLRKVSENDREYAVVVADTEKEMIGCSEYFSLQGAKDFAQACMLNDEDVCEHCGGDGEVACMDYVYDGEPHMAMVGSQKCICQIDEDEQYD